MHMYTVCMSMSMHVLSLMLLYSHAVLYEVCIPPCVHKFHQVFYTTYPKIVLGTPSTIQNSDLKGLEKTVNLVIFALSRERV